MSRLIIWGTGELGGRVARLWRAAGRPVIGLTQTERRHAALRAEGIEPRLGSPVAVLQPEDVLLLAMPGYERQHEAIERLAGQPVPARVGLVSSTGYYGQPRGTVSETSPVGAGRRPAAIAALEQAFQRWAGERGVILRFGGIYRPGRGPFSALQRRGYPPAGPPNKTLALIHYDDAATATLAALQHPAPEAVYLGVVPPCPTRQEFYEAACRQLDLPPPTFEAPLPHPPAVFEVTRLRRDLLPQPAYPDWHRALA